MGLSCGEEIVICLAVSTQSTSVTNGQTDRQTDGHPDGGNSHASIASCGKNACNAGEFHV